MSSFQGRRVGKYYVLRATTGRSWICICTCGREAVVTQNALLSGKCEHKGPKKRHPIYMIWRGMKSRCYTESDSSYQRYGAKGIRVEESWHQFDNFFREFGYLWKSGLSIDRRDGTKGYSNDNCRWATIQEQNNNRSVNYNIKINGVTHTLRQAVDHFGVVPYKTAHARIKRLGWDPIKAASTPTR